LQRKEERIYREVSPGKALAEEAWYSAAAAAAVLKWTASSKM
jgi:hypothetical protein